MRPIVKEPTTACCKSTNWMVEDHMPHISVARCAAGCYPELLGRGATLAQALEDFNRNCASR